MVRLSQEGMTFVEIIMVVAILGILASFAAVEFSDSLTSVQSGTAVEKVASDVRFAQQLALSYGAEVRVHVDLAQNEYSLKWSDGSYVDNPAGGGNFVVRFGQGNYSNVEITNVGFANGRLDFDAGGRPLNSGSDFSGSLGLLTINNKRTIVIAANTGFVSIEEL